MKIQIIASIIFLFSSAITAQEKPIGDPGCVKFEPFEVSGPATFVDIETSGPPATGECSL